MLCSAKMEHVTQQASVLRREALLMATVLLDLEFVAHSGISSSKNLKCIKSFICLLGCPRMYQLLKCHSPQGKSDAKFPNFLKSIKIWALS